MPKKIFIIFGTRPEAIKLAPVIKELDRYPKEFSPIVCVTAQHREMLDQVLRIFNIKPEYDLGIMQKDQTLHDITSRGLLGIAGVIERVKPDIVIVQGDTTTTFAGSLAAFYAKIPVAHVEAGLRTHDKYHPFPEEINRRLTTQIADFHFAPTENSKQNLLKEGIDEKKILVTGNTVIDALFMINKKQSSRSAQEKWNNYFQKNFNIKFSNKKKHILVTGHRRENFGQGFENICYALKEIAVSFEDVDVIYPVHLNPNVQRPVKEILRNIKNIYLIKPLDYEPFVYLMSRSYLILTDSGGVQEEAPSLGKPVLVMREKTERPEAVEAGTVKLVGTDKNKIVREVRKLLNNSEAYKKMSMAHNPYGDGKAASRIVSYFFKLSVPK